MTDQTQKSWMRAAGFGLAVLSVINMLSYLDRYIVAALAESLKHSELDLSDAQLGSLMSGFLVIYTLAAPVFGALGDRRSRPRLIAFAVACWSVATSLSGFAGSYLSLLAARASVGVGEAAYVTIAPSLLSDYFPLRQRGRVMAIFFCATPVGSALGYVVGGLLDKHYGWRSAFFAAGIPGLVLAALCLWLRDPPRGANDDGTAPAVRKASKSSSIVQDTWAAYIRLLHNKPYVLTVLAYAGYTFALGGLAFWMPAFLERVRGISRTEATVSFGTLVVVTGFVGTFAGGWLGDYLTRYSRQAYLWLSAVATLIAAPCVFMALTTASHTLYLTWMVAAQLCLFLSTGPINAAIVNLVSATERATAIALSVFTIHVLGDVPSPFIIGALSDRISLAQAVRIVPIAVVIGGCVWAWAAHAQGQAQASGAPR